MTVCKGRSLTYTVYKLNTVIEVGVIKKTYRKAPDFILIIDLLRFMYLHNCLNG